MKELDAIGERESVGLLGSVMLAGSCSEARLVLDILEVGGREKVG